jgi:hypothetical protein
MTGIGHGAGKIKNGEQRSPVKPGLMMPRSFDLEVSGTWKKIEEAGCYTVILVFEKTGREVGWCE